MSKTWFIPAQLSELLESKVSVNKVAIDDELSSVSDLMDGVDYEVSRGLYMDGERRLKAHLELKRHAHGKTVILDTELQGRVEYRVSQANSDYSNSRWGFATPLSNVGMLCRQAYVGMEGSSHFWGDYVVTEVRQFDRYRGLHSANNLKNFRLMKRQTLLDERDESTVDTFQKYDNVLDKDLSEEQFHVENLAKTNQNWISYLKGDDAPTETIEPDATDLSVESGVEEPETTESTPDMDWMLDGSFDWGEHEAEFGHDEDDAFEEPEFEITDESWHSDRERDDYIGLNQNFYLNPTEEQMAVMASNTKAGPMLVEGIAGSGKTCAALGRAKTLCDLLMGGNSQLEQTDFFSQESSVGFVRTGELVQYLKATCNELGLSHLPIQEYKELQVALREQRDVEIRYPSGKKSNSPRYKLDINAGEINQNETDMRWLNAVDSSLFSCVVNHVIDAISDAKLEANLQVSKPFSVAAAQHVLEEIVADLKIRLGQLLSSPTPGAFKCENAINSITKTLSASDSKWFSNHSYWSLDNNSKWTPFDSVDNVLQHHRNLGGLFLNQSATQYGFQLSTEEELSIFIERCNGEVTFEERIITDSSTWDELSEIQRSYSHQDKQNRIKGLTAIPSRVMSVQLKGRMGERTVIATVVSKENLYILATDYKLHVISPTFNGPAVLPNPLTSYPVQRSGSKVRLSSLFKAQIWQRAFEKLYLTDIYRDALLQAKPNAASTIRLKAQTLNYADIDNLLVFAHLLSKGQQEQAHVPSRWCELSYYRSVFVDEVQDFTEAQIFLMAQQADPQYNAVTMVGDMRQQLGQGQAKAIKNCFPKASVTEFLLKENKRQEFKPTLQALSQLFRAQIQQDHRLITSEEERSQYVSALGQGDGLYVKDSKQVDVEQYILDAIAAQPTGRTIAVVCPHSGMATSLEGSLRLPLAQGDFRESYVADKVDLSKKYLVHFSTPEHVKGLEFDTVCLVGIDSVDWSNEVEVNGVYVALSRPRKELHILGDLDRLPIKVSRLLAGDIDVSQETLPPILNESENQTSTNDELPFKAEILNTEHAEFEYWLPYLVTRLFETEQFANGDVITSLQKMMEREGLDLIERSPSDHEEYLNELELKGDGFSVDFIDDVIDLCSTINIYLEKGDQACNATTHKVLESLVEDISTALN